MRKLFAALIVLGVLAGSSFAATPAIVGGFRDGLAGGFFMEQSIAKNVALRGGLEFNSGNQPLILDLGGKFFLTRLGRSIPLYLDAGFVGYFGNNNSSAGFSIAFIFDNLFDVHPMYFIGGFDIAGQGRLQAQIGYKIY